MILAREFVATLAAWKYRDYEEMTLVPGLGEQWIPDPPKRTVWFYRRTRLPEFDLAPWGIRDEATPLPGDIIPCRLMQFPSYGPTPESYGLNRDIEVTLELFRSETASLAGDIVTDPDVRDIGTSRLFDLVDLIEAAYIETEAGRGFQLDPIRLALKRAELACSAVQEVLDRKRYAAMDAATLDAPVPQTPSPAVDLAELLRAASPRAGNRIAFLEFMRGRSSASFAELCRDVFGGAEMSDGAIRQTVRRVNAFLEERSLPIRFRCGSSHVNREDQPE